MILGSGTSLIWRNDNDFAVLENDIINIYQHLEFNSSIKLAFVPKKIYEGYYLTVAGPDSLVLYDWDKVNQPTLTLPNIIAQKVWWNENNSMMAVATAEKLFIYSLNKKNGALT